MTNLETTIGVLTDYDNTQIVNVEDLSKHRSIYDTHKYCDFRYSTDLQRFVYDPYTGDKIDWKLVEVLLNGKRV